MAGGGKTATSTSQVKIPPEVLARYNAVNAQAQQVSQQPFHPYSMDPNAFVAPLTPTQQMGIYNTNVAAGMAQPYYEQAGQAMQAGLAGAAPMAYAGAMPIMPGQIGGQQIGQYMSPYLGSVVGTTMAAQAQQNAQQRAAMQGQAIQQGAFGGDRAGIAQANLAYQQNLANAQTLANLMNQGYGQALQTAVGQQGVNLAAQQANRQALQQQAQNLYGMYGGYGQALAGLGTGAQQAALQGAQAQLAAGQAQQQTGQAGLAAMYNQFQQQQSYPFQVAQFLANIAMGTGALSGSTTTTTQPAPFFSDRRLKHDVHQIGKTNDGLPIYSFKYNGDDRTQIGLMAQDVEKKHPEAVGLAGGYKTVDYEKATEGAHKAYGGGLSSMGGAVGLEHAGLGFERGGYLGGGLVSSQDLQAILARQQEQFPGYAQMGRDLRGLPGGGKSHVPGGGVHVSQLVTVKAPSMQQQSALQQATGAIGDIEKVWGAGEKGLGAIEKASDWVRGQTGLSASNPQNQTDTSFPTPPSFVPPPEDPNNPLRRYSGGLVRARADGGEADREKDLETVPDKEAYGEIFSGSLDIPTGNGSQPKGLSPAQPAPFTSPNALQDIASIGKTIALFANRGGAIPRHGYATDGSVDDQGAATSPEQDFYNKYLPMAQRVSEETGIHPHVALAQAALESGWGKHAPNYNFFGIKGPGQTLATTEVVDGQTVPTRASFRAYESPEASFSDYGKFLRENPRYRDVLAAREPGEQIAALGRSGYATDPNYASKLLQIAQRFPGGEGVAPADRRTGLAAAQAPAARAEAPARQDAGLAPEQATMMLADASAPSMGGGLGAMRGVVREAREPTFLERNRDWLFPAVSGIGSLLASKSIRPGGAIGEALMGAVQGATKAQELEQAQQQRDVAQQAQNVGAYRGYIEGEVHRHAMALNAFNPRVGYITYDQNGNIVPMKFADYMARVRAGNPPRLVPDGVNKIQEAAQAGVPSAPQAPSAPTPAGTQPPQAPQPPASGAPSARQEQPLWKGITPEIRQQAAQAAEQAVMAEGGLDRPAPEDPVRNPFGKLEEMRQMANQTFTNRMSIMGALNEAAAKGAGGPYSQQIAVPTVNMINSLLSFYGATPDQLFDPAKYGSITEASKLGAQMAANQQLMSGSRAYNELATFLQNNPNPAMDPNGMRRVMSGIMVEQQRAKDLGDFAQHWRNEIQRETSSPVAYTQTGSGFRDAFESRHATQYEADKKKLERIMASNVPVPDPSAPNGVRVENLASYISKNGLAGVRGPLTKMYGPDILRYFGG